MSYIAGPFTASFDAAVVGQVKDGFNIQYFSNKQLIVGDNQGLTPQDAVNLGYECFVEFTLQEWDAAAAKDVFWPQTSGNLPTFGHSFNETTIPVGTLDSSFWKQLILTAVAGSPAAGLTGEDVYTFPRATLAENFPVDILLSARLREVFVRLRLYPDSSYRFFYVA